MRNFRDHALLLSLVSLVLALLAPAHASAYSVGGTRWPGTTIRYHESFPASWDYALNRAVQSWRASGAGIRFVKVASPSQAQLRMFITPNVAGAGYATIGRRSRAELRIKGNPRRPIQLTRANSFDMALLLSHEMGHVLGLDHVNTRCAVMNLIIPPSCSYDSGYAMRCRLWSRDDQLGVLRLYGRARTTPQLPALCFHGPPTPTPANVTITGTGSTGRPGRVTWTRPPGPWTHLELRLYRAGRCGGTGADNLETASLPATATSWMDTGALHRPLGAVCMRLAAYGSYGRPSATVQRTLTYSSWPVSPPTVGELSEWPSQLTDYNAPISFAAEGDALRVRSMPGSAACATTPEEGTRVGAEPSSHRTTYNLYDVPVGEQCLSFFAVAGIGWSTPVTRIVTHSASPVGAPE